MERRGPVQPFYGSSLTGVRLSLELYWTLLTRHTSCTVQSGAMDVLPFTALYKLLYLFGLIDAQD